MCASNLYMFSARRPWYPHFRAALNHSKTIDEIDALLRGRVVKWRGKAGVVARDEDERADDDRDNEKSGENDDLGDLFLVQ
jgi:tRNA-dihydrouridine synthase 1